VVVSKEVITAIKKSQKVVVLTGAGISAESGVPTFRGKDGLWRNHRPEELATPSAFQQDPKLVWEWYDWRRNLIKPLSPNEGHKVIASIEHKKPEFQLITQNVDGLHQKAGSKKCLELHGNIWKMRCTEEKTVIENLDSYLKTIPPICECGAILRPHVVWFGESLDADVIQLSYQAAQSCDFMLVIGTSAVVQPAASLPLIAKNAGAYVVEVNAEETSISNIVDSSFIGKAGEILPLLEKYF
jgi:NAD-dependent deacetylase